MATDKQNLTNKNLDHLTDFLTRELKQPYLAAQIPDSAHIFHGTYQDMAFTRANLKQAASTLLSMTLGWLETAPLVMIFEYKSGEQTVIDLSTETQKQKARQFVESFGEQSQAEVVGQLNELLAT